MNACSWWFPCCCCWRVGCMRVGLVRALSHSAGVDRLIHRMRKTPDRKCHLMMNSFVQHCKSSFIASPTIIAQCSWGLWEMQCSLITTAWAACWVLSVNWDDVDFFSALLSFLSVCCWLSCDFLSCPQGAVFTRWRACGVMKLCVRVHTIIADRYRMEKFFYFLHF